MRLSWVKLLVVAGLALVLALGLSTPAPASQWSDLPESLVAGYGMDGDQVAKISEGFNGVWRPWRDITRAQFTKMAVTAFQAELANPEEASFTDVPKGSLYYRYVEGAKAAGLVNGTTASTFSPHAPITRQEAIAIIARRAAFAQGQDLGSKYGEGHIELLLTGFVDAGEVSPSLRSELAFAFEYGIVKGTDERTISPRTSLWRVQAAALLIRSEALTSPPRVSSVGIASQIAGKLLASVAGKAGSAGFGWVLNMLGAGESIPAETVQALKDIQGQLDQLSAQVDALESLMNDVSYNVLAEGVGGSVSAIQTAQQLLTSLAASSTVSQNQIDDVYAIISTEILPNKNRISNAMLGEGLADSLIESWSRAVAGRDHFFNKADSDAQREMYNYWIDLQAIQEELILEYMHYREYTQNTIETEFDNYVVNLQAQRELFPEELPWAAGYGSPYIVDGTYRNLMLNGQVFATRAMMTQGEALATIGYVNTSNEGLGFSDWRLLNFDPIGRYSPDISTIFTESLPTSVANWMVQQGWELQHLPYGANTTGPKLHLDTSWEEYYAFWDSTANSNDSAYQIGFSPYKTGHVLPVRYVFSDELYFYE